MAAESQPTEPHSAIEHEPLTGLNLASDTPSNDNTSRQPSAIAQVDPEAVSKANSSPSAAPSSKPAAEHKKVSIAETGEETAGVDKSFEAASLVDEDNGNQLDNDNGGLNTHTGVGEKKKKKKKKPKSQRGLNNPTGFEEYYVDPPITPAEFEEEKSLYDTSLPFAMRIEKGIQRFLAKRKLDSLRLNLFTKYLMHGGIDAGPNMFSGGLDAETLATRNAAEIAELRATTFVGSDKIDIGKSDHVVDFEGCLGSFLSHTLPAQFELQSEDRIKYFIGIIRNFFNYLLHHDICPDYNDQVYAARTLCDRAEKELWAVTQCTPMLPGDFNKACSEIFGGMYQGMWSENQEWMQGMDLDYDVGISPHHARKVFKYAFAANADDDTHKTYRQQLKGNATKIKNIQENAGFEVTEILFPSQDTLDFYAQPEAAGLKPVGKLRAKTWIIPTAAEEDLTEEEEKALATKPLEIRHYEFWIEADVLSQCVVGMKIEATVTDLSFGVSYFDAIFGLHCSFYQLLPNELMVGWREPEKEWLPMKKKRQGDESGEVDFDDIPGEVGEENKMLDDGIASGKQLTANAENAANNVGHDLLRESGEISHEDESGGSHSTHGRLNVMPDTAVTVREIGEKLVQVSGNADKVLEKTFDVKPRHDE